MIIWEICRTSLILNYGDEHESYCISFVFTRENRLSNSRTTKLKGQICTLGAGIIEFRLNKLKIYMFNNLAFYVTETNCIQNTNINESHSNRLSTSIQRTDDSNNWFKEPILSRTMHYYFFNNAGVFWCLFTIKIALLGHCYLRQLRIWSHDV